jgi:hypothetical protein
MVSIEGFEFDSSLIDELVDFPWSIYGDDPGWIPPLKQSIRAELSPANPVWAHARRRCFLARLGSIVVGRCVATIDDRLRVGGTPVGMVGYFEVRDDYAVTTGLLDAAVGWLRDNGARTIWGPVDISIFNRYRFKTDGFDREPHIGEPYHPAYYVEQFERYGFERHERFVSWDLDIDAMRLFKARCDRTADKAIAAGYRMRNLDMDRFEDELRLFYELALDAFVDRPGYVPLELSEFSFWNQGMKPLLDPSVVAIGHAPDDEVATALYCFPNAAELLRRLDGTLDPAAFADGTAQLRPSLLLVHTIIVLERHRGSGLLSTAFAKVLENALARGYQSALALFTRSKTIFDDVMEPTREYWLYQLTAA